MLIKRDNIYNIINFGGVAMAKETVFRRSVFGGFDRKQVIGYITSLSAKCTDPATRDEILRLRKYISDLEDLIKTRNETLESLTIELEQNKISGSTVPEAILAIQTIVNTHRKVQTVNDELNTITELISNTIAQRKPKINSMLTKIDEINEQIVTLQAGLKAVSLKLSQVHFDSITLSEEIPCPQVTEEPPEAKAETDVITDLETADEIYDETNELYSPIVIEYDDEDELTVNSIDNFFRELDKLAEAKLFDLTTILDNNSDNI